MSIVAAYLGVIAIWSTTPLAVKWSGEADVLLGAFGRMLVAAVICLALLRLLRKPFPWHGAARRVYRAAALGAFGSLGLIYVGAQHIPSGLVAVLFGLTPLGTSLAARWILGVRDLTPARLAGVAMGLVGLAVLFGSGHLGGEGMLFGLIMTLGAVVLNCFSLVLVKRANTDLPGLTVTTGAVVLAAPLFLGLWLATGATLPAALPARTLWATVYLGLVGSVVGFTLYFYIVRRLSTATVSGITLVSPVTALLLGQALNGETIEPGTWAGVALVLAGLALHQWGDPWRLRSR